MLSTVSTLGALLKRPQLIVIFLLIGMLGYGGIKYYDHTRVYADLKLQFNKQTQIIRALNETLIVKEREIGRIERVQIVADQAQDQAIATQQKYDVLIKQIEEAKENDDAETAPVLQRTLDSVDGLR